MQEKTKIITKFGISTAFTVIFVIAMIILLVLGYKAPFLHAEITYQEPEFVEYDLDYTVTNDLNFSMNNVKVIINFYDINDNYVGKYTTYRSFDSGQNDIYTYIHENSIDFDEDLVEFDMTDTAYVTITLQKPLLYNLGYAMIPFIIIFGYGMAVSLIALIQSKNKEKANSERKVENLVAKPAKKQKDKAQKEIVAEVNSASETLNNSEKTEETNSQSNNIKESADNKEAETDVDK